MTTTYHIALWLVFKTLFSLVDLISYYIWNNYVLLNYNAFPGNYHGVYTAQGAKVIILRGSYSFVQTIINWVNIVDFHPPAFQITFIIIENYKSTC